MKLIAAILLTVCLASCYVPKHTAIYQKQIVYIRSTHDSLVFMIISDTCDLTSFFATRPRNCDSIYLLDRTIERKKLSVGDWYTIQYDSSRFKIINGKKYLWTSLKPSK